jgi:uncharacterized protein (TIGR00159 family)
VIRLAEGVRLPHDIIDILLVAFVIYRLLLMIKGTRAFQVLVGLVIILGAYLGSQVLGFVTLHWILDAFLSSFILVVVVLFQNDIRRALAQVGQHPLWAGRKGVSPQGSEMVEELVKASTALAKKKIGALLVIERGTRLAEHVEGGVPMNALLSGELLQSIFVPESPLHDGAAIIRDTTLVTAACFLPLTTRVDLERGLGTRHRAAMGITEETDAVAIVVSEETGAVSIGLNGKITRDLDAAALRKVLGRLFPVSSGITAPRGRRSRPHSRPAEKEAGA